MSDKNKTLLIVREPKVDIPEAFLRKVIKEFPNGGGYAVQKDGELVTDHSDTGATLSDVQDLMKSAASYRILFAFNKLETMKEHMLQPFNVAIDGDDTVISFGIDGHFPSMVEAGHTEESLLAQRVMFPNIQKRVQYSGGDLDKFVAELRDPTFVDMVMSRIGDRGSFVFLPPVGEAIWLGKNKAGSTYPWGQVSNTLGYTETPATSEVTPKAEAKKGWWGKSKGPEVPVAQDQPTPKVEPAAPAAPSPGPLNIPAAEPDTKVKPPEVTPAALPKEAPAGHWETIPKGLSNDQRKKLIRRVTNCGSVLPENWRVDPFPYWVVDYPKDPKMVDLAHKASTMRAETAATPAPKSGKEIAVQKGMGDPLMLTKEEMTAIEEHILRVLGKISKTPPDLLEIQKSEEKYAKFSQQFGVKLDLLHNWTPADIRLLGPKGLFHYVLELRRNEINAAGSTSSSDVQHAATETLKAEAPAPASSAPNPKGFWGKTKAA